MVAVVVAAQKLILLLYCLLVSFCVYGPSHQRLHTYALLCGVVCDGDIDDQNVEKRFINKITIYSFCVSSKLENTNIAASSCSIIFNLFKFK